MLSLGPATVSVAVATVWRHPSSPRAVDAAALANPVRIQQWLSTMTLSQRRALGGRADTQVLLGERVRVLAVSGAWARVVVPDQPSPRDRRGYPGWLPVRQLSGGSGPSTGAAVTVAATTAWLRTPSGARLMKVSYGTRLAALGQSAAHWNVLLPSGRPARIAATSVVTSSQARTPHSVMAGARQFLGLSYLWAGTSGFGFDCSGVMEIDYRVHGIQIPRDAAAQATCRLGWFAGRAAAAGAILVLLWRSNGHIHENGERTSVTVIDARHILGPGVWITDLSAVPTPVSMLARRFWFDGGLGCGPHRRRARILNPG